MDNKHLTPDLEEDGFHSWTEQDLHQVLQEEERAGQNAVQQQQMQQQPQNQQYQQQQPQQFNQPAVINQNPDDAPITQRNINEDEMSAYNQILDDLDPNGNPGQGQVQPKNPNYLDPNWQPLEDPNAQQQQQIQQQQTQTQTQTQTQQPQNQQNQGDGGNVYSAAFDILTEMGLIQDPGDVEQFDENTLAQVRQQTMVNNQRNAIANIRQNISRDPMMLELFDYAMNGAGFADIPAYRAAQQQEVDYANLDMKDEGIQQALVENYLKATGTPDKFIPKLVEDIKDGLKMEVEAQEAQKFFVEESRKIREQEQARIQEEQKRRQAYEQQEQQRIQQWNHHFEETMKQRKWSNEVKQQVYNQYQEVQLENGNTMPMYQYKEAVIRNNPVLFQEYLNFLSQFDPRTGTFQNRQQELQQQTQFTKKLLDNLNKKRTQNRGGNQTRQQQNTTGMPPAVNPHNEL
jgi:hypothetical protein